MGDVDDSISSDENVTILAHRCLFTVRGYLFRGTSRLSQVDRGIRLSLSQTGTLRSPVHVMASVSQTRSSLRLTGL